jgi:hypothetical protein
MALQAAGGRCPYLPGTAVVHATLALADVALLVLDMVEVIVRKGRMADKVVLFDVREWLVMQ